MTISLRATRSFVTNDVSLDGPVTITQGTTNNYNITDYNRFSTYTATASVGTVSISGAVVTLVVPTTTATQIKLSVTKDNTVSNFNIAVGATAIITPTITSPTEGSVNVNVSPTLASTPFTTAPVGADTHQSSQWQVSTNSAFTAIVYDSGTTTVNKTSINVPALALNTVHYARVRYTGATLGTSTWSATRTFTTTNQYVATPSVSTTGSTAAVGGSPTFTGSPFSPVNGSDTHSATDWIVTKISDSSVVYQSIGDTINKTSITIPSGLLQINTQYRIQVRYAGASFGYSGYGQLDFTTASKFSYDNYLAAYTTTQVVVYGQDIDSFVKLPTLPALNSRNVGLATGAGGGQVLFSPSGTHLVGIKENQSYLTVYKRTGDSLTVLPNTPLVQPTGEVGKVGFSADNQYLAVPNGTIVTVYSVSGDNYSKVVDITDSGAGSAYCAAFSADATYLAIGKTNGAGPVLYIYKRVGNTFNSLTSFRIAPVVINSLHFSPDTNLLAAGGKSAGIYIYARSADTYTLETTLLPDYGGSSGAADFSWSLDSTRLLVAARANTIFQRNSVGNWTQPVRPTGGTDNGAISEYSGGASWSGANYIAASNHVNSTATNHQFITLGKFQGSNYLELSFLQSANIGFVKSLHFYPGTY